MNAIWSYRLGMLLVTASAIAWSTAGLFTRLIPLDVWTLLLWRGGFGALGLLIFMVLHQGRRGLASFADLGVAGWAFVVVGTIGMVCFITSLRLTSVAHTSIIYATVPLVAAALAWWAMHEKPSTSAMIASLAALLGVAIMVGLGADGSLAGDLLAFGMTVCMATIMVIARRYLGIPMLAAVCLSVLLSALVAAPFAQWGLPSGEHVLLLALFGLVNTALGTALFAIGSRRLPASETALIGALDAPLAPIWVLLVFGELPSGTTLVGGAIVFMAILAHMVRGAKQNEGNNTAQVV